VSESEACAKQCVKQNSLDLFARQHGNDGVSTGTQGPPFSCKSDVSCPGYLLASYRNGDTPAYRSVNVGIRCVVAVESSR
jgi:hypothetical protein